MSKKNKRDKEDLSFTISKEEMKKMERRVNRQIRLERGDQFIRTGPHLTSKKDYEEKKSNKLASWEIEELLEDEFN